MDSDDLQSAIAEEIYVWSMENALEPDELWKPFDRLSYTQREGYLEIASRIIDVYEDMLEEVEEM